MDDKGKPDFNQKLSEERADSVVAWLKKNGVEESRLSHKGFGQERPIVKNDTDAHREQNRRVEFKIWEIDGKPTDAQTNDAQAATAAPAGAGSTATPASTKTTGKKP